MHVLNLSERSPELIVTVESSLAAELLNSLCAFSTPSDYPTFDLGAEWFETRRAAIPPDLMETIGLFTEAVGTRMWGHFLGLVHETPAPRDVAAFLAQIEVTPTEELRRYLLDYYGEFDPVRREAARLAAIGDRAALEEVLAHYFPTEERRAAVRDRLFPPDNPDALKTVLLDTLKRWESILFGEVELEIQPILERDAKAKRVIQRTGTPQRLIDVALNGIEYTPEPGIREVVLIPSYIWRPWVVLYDYRDLKVIIYPVADDSVSLSGDDPPARLLKLYKALGDERRLRTLKKLASGDNSLQELADHLGLAKSTMHHHLAILRGAGLVRLRVRNSGDMQYSLRRDPIPDAAELLRGYLS